MHFEDLVIGEKYRLDHDDGHQYFATVEAKASHGVQVTLGDQVNRDGDPGETIDRAGIIGRLWVDPSKLHPL